MAPTNDQPICDEDSVLEAARLAADAAARAQGGREHGYQFVRDLADSYQFQRIAVDLEDIARVLSDLQAPILGVGTAEGPDRPTLAARIAMRGADQIGNRVLALVTFPPGEARLQDIKRASDAVREAASPSADLIFGLACDPGLPSGSIRVSMLTD